MAEVPLNTNALRRSKQPAASVCASASLQPTLTGIPSGSPNRLAAAAVTVPRGAQAGRSEDRPRAASRTR